MKISVPIALIAYYGITGNWGAVLTVTLVFLLILTLKKEHTK